VAAGYTAADAENISCGAGGNFLVNKKVDNLFRRPQYEPGGFKFDDKTAAVFDDRIERSVSLKIFPAVNFF
jgi:hypothetical protein